ncbi:hypothetical protein DFH08DRAFT_811087 [Mycena albidolilacea]|uniref:Uncharacterized protein n=1 Tax=Mycena albidolilacea TaxID=1033008 RepID=A0AAD6ZX30_9AGAR|nr:hypothetical protein DFH08DRAFT_811087 [Mycena albidolilacea]
MIGASISKQSQHRVVSTGERAGYREMAEVWEKILANVHTVEDGKYVLMCKDCNGDEDRSKNEAKSMLEISKSEMMGVSRAGSIHEHPDPQSETRDGLQLIPTYTAEKHRGVATIGCKKSSICVRKAAHEYRGGDLEWQTRHPRVTDRIEFASTVDPVEFKVSEDLLLVLYSKREFFDAFSQLDQGHDGKKKEAMTSALIRRCRPNPFMMPPPHLEPTKSPISTEPITESGWHSNYYIALGTWPPKGFGPDLDVPREFLPGLWPLDDRRASSGEIEHIYDNFGAVLSARRI